MRQDALLMNARLLLPTLLLWAASPAAAQNNNNNSGDSDTGPTPTQPVPENFRQDGVWTGSLKGGRYVLKCAQIIALSKHEYIADGSARVVEVNLALNSSMVVRFYYLEPARLEGTGAVAVGQQAIDRARQMVQSAAEKISPSLTQPRVVKSYPASTHAHTVEYVIAEEARLNSLFDSLEAAFRDPGRKHFWRE